MKELIFATNNAHKLTEVRALFKGTGVEVLSLSDVNCVHETVEDGKTFYENAAKKAREIAAITGKAAVADDTGLCVAALDGAPGVYSARFAPEGERCEKLLQVMEGKEDRTAYFMTAAVLVFPDGRELSSVGRVEGEITLEKRGDNHFGYDPVFYSVEAGKTFAEMNMDEKNHLSHRGRAFSALLEKMKKENLLEE